MIVEVIRYNGILMYRHPLLDQLVLAPEGAKLGQRLDFDNVIANQEFRDWEKIQMTVEDKGVWPPVPQEFLEDTLPISWEDRPKL